MKKLAPILLIFAASPSLADGPSVFDLALQDAETRLEGYEDARFAFTRTIETGTDRTVLAYDPAAETPWTLVEGGENAEKTLASHNETAAKADEPPDAGAILDDPRKSFARNGEPVFLREEAGAYVYAMPVNSMTLSGAGRSADVAKHLNGEIFIAKNDPRFLKLRIFAKGPFKPVPVAKVEAMNVTIVFAPVDGGEGPLAVHGQSVNVSGSAMFRDFTEKSVTTNSGFERVTLD